MPEGPAGHLQATTEKALSQAQARATFCASLVLHLSQKVELVRLLVLSASLLGGSSMPSFVGTRTVHQRLMYSPSPFSTPLSIASSLSLHPSPPPSPLPSSCTDTFLRAQRLLDVERAPPHCLFDPRPYAPESPYATLLGFTRPRAHVGHISTLGGPGIALIVRPCPHGPPPSCSPPRSAARAPRLHPPLPCCTLPHTARRRMSPQRISASPHAHAHVTYAGKYMPGPRTPIHARVSTATALRWHSIFNVQHPPTPRAQTPSRVLPHAPCTPPPAPQL